MNCDSCKKLIEEREQIKLSLYEFLSHKEEKRSQEKYIEHVSLMAQNARLRKALESIKKTTKPKTAYDIAKRALK